MPDIIRKLKRLFSNKQSLIAIGLIAVFGMLIAAIVALVIALASPKATNSNGTNMQSHSNGSSFDSGTVSSLAGGASSYRNLKGLTLRINQIDTCHPKQISAYISVSTEEGQVNKNFGKSDVKVYLDGQKIADFDFSSVDTNKLPLANMLAIDHSGSMAGDAMNNAKSAASSYVDQLKSADQVGLIQFDHRIERLAEMSTDKARVKTAITEIAAQGDTAIYDALNQSVETVPDCGRKAVTVLTDGTDTASKTASEQSVIDLASKKNLPIFAVGVKSAGFDSSSIRAISEKTGGQYLEANTPDEIAAVYKKIDSQLTGQFLANFNLKIKKDGSLHTLKIISDIEGSETGSERTFIY